ncbi:hypothetical protein SAMN03080617_01055 [Algoriphagus alkaliphilus]|uniref:CHAD domain-containing protein n=1 Tax=Algoriphagus alkaliphilus TaxID=279824 RepID=A0A1G5WDP2_9BACT|nr:hypothetical protein [Algoriphagus alkaliphilus]MBA4299239.1 hypothetical protein [Cyclobacterium sp.]SDA56190.1 hypothetical protein SAMN03080617_01055 [Algoriphagus alkaliphilus]
MQVKTSPVFLIFEQQHQEAKILFLALGKQINSKKAIELQTKLEFLELFTELMEKIHFENESLSNELFLRFKPLKKSLRKTHHLKLVERNLKSKEERSGLQFDSYRDYLLIQKKKIQKEAFDLVVGSTLKTWDDFRENAQKISRGIKPLTINTAINQLFQDELIFLHRELKAPISSQGFRDLFESLRKIIMLENLLIQLGFNPIFVSSIHEEIAQVKDQLKPWYSNHLAFQTLSGFLAEKTSISKKYMDWIKELKEEKKSLSSEIEKQAFVLLKKVLI